MKLILLYHDYGVHGQYRFPVLFNDGVPVTGNDKSVIYACFFPDAITDAVHQFSDDRSTEFKPLSVIDFVKLVSQRCRPFLSDPDDVLIRARLQQGFIDLLDVDRISLSQQRGWATSSFHEVSNGQSLESFNHRIEKIVDRETDITDCTNSLKRIILSAVRELDIAQLRSQLP